MTIFGGRPGSGLICLCLLFLLGSGEVCLASPRRSPCRIRYPSDATVDWTCRRLRSGERLEGLFGDRSWDVLRFNRIDRRHAYWGVPLKVPKRLDAIEGFTPMPPEYPPAAEEEKFILVDLSEQFLGAYEYGRLVFSAPVATGEKGHKTPTGEFRITTVHRNHRSSEYYIENTDVLYPMDYGLMFHVDRNGASYWIHGRDLPGYPASHGCIGLYDEAMQKKYYKSPKSPVLADAATLFAWVIGALPEDGRFMTVEQGPRVVIVGQAP